MAGRVIYGQLPGSSVAYLVAIGHGDEYAIPIDLDRRAFVRCHSCGRVADKGTALSEHWGCNNDFRVHYDDSYYCPACAVLSVV